MRRRIDYSVLRVTAATSAALLAAGCGGGTMIADQPTRVCVDDLGRRVADASCSSGRATGGGGAHAYYYGRGDRVPDVGETARGGSRLPTSGTSYSTPSEGSVSRGGFGRSASVHGFGGGE